MALVASGLDADGRRKNPGVPWALVGSSTKARGLGQVHGSAGLRSGCLTQEEGGGYGQRVQRRGQAGHWESTSQGGGGRERGPASAEGGAPGEGHAMSLRAA